MSSHISPVVSAMADQFIAAADRALDQFVADFKAHLADHDGDPICPVAVLAIGSENQARIDLAFMFAVAVKRLAMPRTEIEL